MNFLYFGVDISKDSLDYAICKSTDKEVIEVDKVTNNVRGIKQFVKKLKRVGKQTEVWVCFENTGHYGLLLSHLLQENKITYSMVPAIEIIKSSGMTRGKSDPVDAKRIATYAATFAHKLTETKLQSKSDPVDAKRIATYAATFAHKLTETKLQSSEILRMKTLLSMRENFVRSRTQFKNAEKALVISSQTISLTKEIKLYQKSIKECDQKIKIIEKEIQEIIKLQEEIAKTYNKMLDIVGIGPITAAFIICYTNNFNSFEDPRKFNCFCGLAPFQYTSGTSVKGKTKTSRYRNKILKKLLFNAASTAIQHDMQLRSYYNRKIQEGKHFMSVKNAVACKLVSRIFAVVKRNEPFVKFSC